MRILGNYTVGSLLGRGGTSEVYAGEHRFLGDAVAIKLVRASAATDGLLAEARRTRAIQHPNVVRVLDFGEAEGDLYLVMERITGGSLAARLRERGPLDEASVRRLGAGIADGLAAAHALGIVHCDLKPANVMLAGDVPKVVDFGIAQHLGTGAASGPRMGTPAYMAPELRDGAVAAPAVDVWSLGVLLYEALTGELPPVQPAPPCSPELAALIARCLERDPARRPPAMAQIASALRGDGDERVTEPLDEPAPPPTAPRRSRRWVPIASGVALAAAAIVVWQLAVPTSAGSPVVAASPPPRVAPAPPPTVTDAPAPLPRVAITSTPPGATIVIGGVAVGRTPATLELALPVEIELRRRGFRTARARATAATPLDVRLVPQPRARPPCPIPPCETLD
jgi:eukaryotic-like serine/threonine-protein kinase